MESQGRDVMSCCAQRHVCMLMKCVWMPALAVLQGMCTCALGEAFQNRVWGLSKGFGKPVHNALIVLGRPDQASESHEHRPDTWLHCR